MRLEGTVLIVTGSATGVGAACAERAARDGARVVINYSRSEEEARATEARCKTLGAETLVVRADVSSDVACRDVVTRALQKWGRIDALVNNAATTKAADPSDLALLSAEDFQRVYAVNLIGAYQMARAVTATMRKQGRGAIVNVSSNVAFTGGGSSLAYLASKGALNALTLGLARALGPEIRVNAVCPGVINTRWMRNAVGEEKYSRLEARFRESSPMGRVAEPADVAELVIWLVSASEYLTGELIGIDGGIRLAARDRSGPS